MSKKMRVFKSEKDGDWYVTILGANGEPVFTSEGHKNRAEAEQIAHDYSPRGAVLIQLVNDGEVVRYWLPFAQ